MAYAAWGLRNIKQSNVVGAEWAQKSKVVDGGRDGDESRGWGLRGSNKMLITTVSILAFTLSEMGTIRES